MTERKAKAATGADPFVTIPFRKHIRTGTMALCITGPARNAMVMLAGFGPTEEAAEKPKMYGEIAVWTHSRG